MTQRTYCDTIDVKLIKENYAKSKSVGLQVCRHAGWSRAGILIGEAACASTNIFLFSLHISRYTV